MVATRHVQHGAVLQPIFARIRQLSDDSTDLHMHILYFEISTILPAEVDLRQMSAKWLVHFVIFVVK
jgi:hypothetical protein